MDEQVEAEIRAVRDARDALRVATWELGGNPASLQARANTLAEAELRLALARATAFATFRQSHTLTEAQRETLVNQVASGTLNGGGIAGIGVGGARPPTPPGPAGTE